LIEPKDQIDRLTLNQALATGPTAPQDHPVLPLALAFLLTAALYASVGFGGGSTYTALLALGGVDYRLLPLISLSCNIVVVTGGTIRYAHAGLVPWRRIAPLVALSVPFAFLGGLTPIREAQFIALLGASLLAAGLLLLFQPTASQSNRPNSVPAEAALGAGGGYLSGVVGIGGGIFLPPIQHLTRWGDTRAIAATASVFILANSLAGLAGQVAKLDDATLVQVLPWWPLVLAVLIGGQVGGLIGLRVAPALIKRATGLLILAIAIQLLVKTLFG